MSGGPYAAEGLGLGQAASDVGDVRAQACWKAGVAAHVAAGAAAEVQEHGGQQ